MRAAKVETAGCLLSLGFSPMQTSKIIRPKFLSFVAGALCLCSCDQHVPGAIGKAQHDVQTLSAAIRLYSHDLDRLPTSKEGLHVLVKTGADDSRGYIDRIPKDPWGRSYVYDRSGVNGAFTVCSLGADGRQGGEGRKRDICAE